MPLQKVKKKITKWAFPATLTLESDAAILKNDGILKLEGPYTLSNLIVSYF